MDRNEFEAKFTESATSVKSWIGDHPKAAAVITALIAGLILGAVLFH